METYCSKVCSCGEDLDAALEAGLKAKAKLEEMGSVVKTVNGIPPDENGNVTVSGGGGGSGEPGEDGFSPIATVEQTDSGAVISITDKNGTTTATVTNGKDGSAGSVSWNELEDKPFGENVTVNSHGMVYLDKTLEFTAEGDVYTSESVGLGVNFLEGHDYCFIWDGTEYHLMAQGDGTSTLSSGLVWAGNGSIVDSELPDTGEPFYVTRADNYASMNRLIVFKTADESAAHTVKASSVNITRELKQLDEKFIPDTVARTADVQTMIDTALGVIENGTY